MWSERGFGLWTLVLDWVYWVWLTCMFLKDGETCVRKLTTHPYPIFPGMSLFLPTTEAKKPVSTKKHTGTCSWIQFAKILYLTFLLQVALNQVKMVQF